VTNRPVNFGDPTGHRPCEDLGDGSCLSERQYTTRLERDREARRKGYKLKKELDNFDPPDLVDESDMLFVGWKDDEPQYLAPDEAALFLAKCGKFCLAVDFPSLVIMYYLYEEADNTTYELYKQYDPFGKMHNSTADAFHHAYFSALITRHFGPTFAERFMTAHETRPGSKPSEVFMDLHNNQVGIEIALANGAFATDSMLQNAITDSIDKGELYIWNGYDIHYSNDSCLNCGWKAGPNE
jgi:hypothetical protein